MSEDHTTEYKQSWRDEYLKWICGFANADGGVLEIGRNDQGEAVGVDESTKLLKDLPNKIHDVLRSRSIPTLPVRSSERE